MKIYVLEASKMHDYGFRAMACGGRSWMNPKLMYEVLEALNRLCPG